jgi:hypothetical protein
MMNASLIWVTDSLYDRKKAIYLCRVGWIIFCTKTGFCLTGTFWEKSISASLFRAKMLDLCTLHHLTQAVVEYYKIKGWSAMLCCDNKRALELSSHHKRRIQPSAKCAGICRSLQTTKQTFKGTFRDVHIYGHMDRYLKWEQLMLTQQLNCVCNTLAKNSITIAINKGYHNRQYQLLPNKDVALIIWGGKITADILSPLRFHASKEVARKYLGICKRNKWSNECFNAVDWEHLELALKNKVGMYRIWGSKQNSGFCGTRVQGGCYSGDLVPNERCPN